MNTNRRYPVMAGADDQGGGGGAAAPAAAPTPAATPAPAAPAAAPAAPAAPAAAPTPAAPAAPAAPTAPTAAPAASATPAAPTPKPDWPDDWRTKASKGDEKRLARLSRYGSPVDVADALIAAQNRIDAGEVKPVLGKDATPEQLAEWRAAHGIPAAPKDYDVSELKTPKADKPFVDRILKVAHDTNQTPDQVKATLRSYYELRDMVEAKVAEQDKQAEAKGHDALREEWGNNYRLHSNLIANLLAGTSAGALQEQLMNGRLADGTLIKNSPEVQKFLLSVALIQNPAGTVVPGGGNPAQGIRDELKKIADTRAKDNAAYVKDNAMQERERRLITAAISAGIMDSAGKWKEAA